MKNVNILANLQQLYTHLTHHILAIKFNMNIFAFLHANNDYFNHNKT